MALFIRAKRVTDPLADEVRARLTSPDYSSSGSDHDATDPSFFSSLLHAFLDADDHESTAYLDDSGDEEEDGMEDWYTEIAEKVSGLLNPAGKEDGLRRRIKTEVAAGLRSNETADKRAVMARLRELGYNAGLCKSKWNRSGRLAAGSYEYIDVVAPLPSGDEIRYIVELDLAGELEIARATAGYNKVVKVVPEVAVMKAEGLKEAVRMVAEATRRSMKKQGLHVPPWRKGRYMMAKWFGPYRRTVNPAPAETAGGLEVKCLNVGFWPAAGIVATPPAPPRIPTSRKNMQLAGLIV